MTTAAFAPTRISDSPGYQDVLFEVATRARRGDPDALAYVFDNVFYDVYHEVLTATRDRAEAERATRKALHRLPEMLRSRRYESLTELRESLVRQAMSKRSSAGKAGAPVGGMENLRAGIRHLVLISAGFIAAAGALILTF
jgi:hypothetical protein